MKHRLLIVIIAVAALASAASAQRYTVETPRHLLIKSNAVGWSLLVANIGAEYELSPSWSITLPVYYGACNYFTRTVKFRTLAFRPEARYWFKEAQSGEMQKGWLVGPHIGIAWYNMAIGGSVRYQDHKGHTPAFGAGITAGWRTTFGEDSRWGFEVSIGMGVYRLYYDKWVNVANGSKLGEVRKVLPCIDNVGITFFYSFSATR